MKHTLVLALALGALACRRPQPQSPRATPDATRAGPDRPAVTPSPPSADALVLVPGEGLGPFALGASRAAVRSLLTDAREPTPTSLEADGFTVLLDGPAPGGVVTSVRVALAQASGGVRVGDTVVRNDATYPEVVSAVGNCAAPVANRGATITPCQNGGVKVLQSGPAGELHLEVSR